MRGFQLTVMGCFGFIFSFLVLLFLDISLIIIVSCKK
jgi:hypothetical protein